MRVSIIILLLIPAAIAFGHDFWLFYEQHLNPGIFSIDLFMKEFKLTALGYLWTTYDVESYKLTVQSMSKEEWAKIDYILTFKTLHVALGFAAIITALFVLLGIIGKGPFKKPDDGTIKKSKIRRR
ncbi:MAG: hypothetical protein CBB87_02285 [Micavibrio sp. TMED27]|nr:hypothetical protein [Micavibrio sp.]OUT92591.1 MAG: hypothetical protein CBB87_02285 [Micavibrio sp. TMED27]|tara:strand:- start:1916 stop:2293 length:378 start_codon:yes stop_codon:yes gene_type:complete